jgi:TPR repeat protein
LKLYRGLAERENNAQAQHTIGLMYENGYGVTRDYAEAMKWFRMAAEQGYTRAQSQIGLMYEKAEGLTQDYAEALKWFRMAAERGDVEEQLNVGGSYENGLGVKQDYVQAYMWLSLAAAADEPASAQELNNLAQKMTPEQIVEAKQLASEWKRTPALPLLRRQPPGANP